MGLRSDDGNTFASDTGHKTRQFDDVLGEIQGFFAVHNAQGSWPEACT